MNPDQNQRQYWQGNGNGHGYGYNYGGYSSGYGQQYQRGHGAHPGQEEYGRHYNGASQGRVDPRSPHGQYPPKHYCGASSSYRSGPQQTPPRRPDPVRTTPHSRPVGSVTPNRPVTPKTKPFGPSTSNQTTPKFHGGPNTPKTAEKPSVQGRCGPSTPNKTTPLSQGTKHTVTPKVQSRPAGPTTPKPCVLGTANQETTPKAQGKLFGQKPISRSPKVQGRPCDSSAPKEPLPTADPKAVAPSNAKPLEQDDTLNNTYTVLDSDEENNTTPAPIPEIQVTTVADIEPSPENLKSEDTNIKEVIVEELEEIVNAVDFEKHVPEERIEEAKPELLEQVKSEVPEEVKLDLPEQAKSDEVLSELEVAKSEEVLKEDESKLKVAKTEGVLEEVESELEVAKSVDVLEEAKSEELLQKVIIEEAKPEEHLEQGKSELLEEDKSNELQQANSEHLEQGKSELLEEDKSNELQEANSEHLEQGKSVLLKEDKSNELQEANSEYLCELAQSKEVESERPLMEEVTAEPLVENAMEGDEPKSSVTPKKEHEVLSEKLEKLTIKSTPLKSARKSRGVLLDSTNIVESSSIKFIVREKNDSEVLVTPVRRSNRKKVQTPAKTDEAVTLAGLGPDVHVLPNKFLQID